MKRFLLGLLATVFIATTAFADSASYSDDYENTYTVATEFNWPTGSGPDFGFYSSGAGIWGSGWGNDNGSHSVYSGAAVNSYKTVYHQAVSGTFRTIALSATATKYKVRLGPNAGTSLDNKLQVWGLTNTAATTSALASGGGAHCACFRIDAAGSAALVYAVTKIGASETTTSTGITDTAGTKHTYEIIADSSQVVFIVDGTTVATHTTNLPTAGLGAVAGVMSKVASQRLFNMDWLKYQSARL